MCKPIPNMDLYKGNDMVRSFTGLPHPLMNLVVRAQLDDENLEVKVEETIYLSKQRKVPFMWMIGPSSSPKSLGKIIRENELTKLDNNPGMAMDLRKIDEIIFHEAKNGSNVTIKQVLNADELRSYINIVSKCFDFPDLAISFASVFLFLLLLYEWNL